MANHDAFDWMDNDEVRQAIRAGRNPDIQNPRENAGNQQNSIREEVMRELGQLDRKFGKKMNLTFAALLSLGAVSTVAILGYLNHLSGRIQTSGVAAVSSAAPAAATSLRLNMAVIDSSILAKLNSDLSGISGVSTSAVALIRQNRTLFEQLDPRLIADKATVLQLERDDEEPTEEVKERIRAITGIFTQLVNIFNAAVNNVGKVEDLQMIEGQYAGILVLLPEDSRKEISAAIEEKRLSLVQTNANAVVVALRAEISNLDGTAPVASLTTPVSTISAVIQGLSILTSEEQRNDLVNSLNAKLREIAQLNATQIRTRINNASTEAELITVRTDMTALAGLLGGTIYPADLGTAFEAKRAEIQAENLNRMNRYAIVRTTTDHLEQPVVLGGRTITRDKAEEQFNLWSSIVTACTPASGAYNPLLDPRSTGNETQDKKNRDDWQKTLNLITEKEQVFAAFQGLDPDKQYAIALIIVDQINGSPLPTAAERDTALTTSGLSDPNSPLVKYLGRLIR